MDQNQDQLDPEIAQEVIALLNRKITNLRNENAQLQVWSNRVLENQSCAEAVNPNATGSIKQILRQGGR